MLSDGGTWPTDIYPAVSKNFLNGSGAKPGEMAGKMGGCMHVNVCL